MRLKTLAVGTALATSIMLSGCGTNPGDRAVSGGLIGAGAGAVIGAVSGAVVGAATDPCDLDLGKPFWKEHGGRAAYERRCGHPPP